MALRKLVVAAVVVLGSGVAAAMSPLGRDVLFHAVPLSWTGEAERLAQVLDLRDGQTVADIGAGNGSLIVALAPRVGSSGRAYATERSPEQRQAIARRAAGAGVAVAVVDAAERSTQLPDSCCDAITMRMVLHHIGDLPGFAQDLRRSLRHGGRLAIIDFRGGALPHLDDDHGIDPQQAEQALVAAGFRLVSRDDAWGGRTYLILLTAP